MSKIQRKLRFYEHPFSWVWNYLCHLWRPITFVDLYSLQALSVEGRQRAIVRLVPRQRTVSFLVRVRIAIGVPSFPVFPVVSRLNPNQRVHHVRLRRCWFSCTNDYQDLHIGRSRRTQQERVVLDHHSRQSLWRVQVFGWGEFSIEYLLIPKDLPSLQLNHLLCTFPPSEACLYFSPKFICNASTTSVKNTLEQSARVKRWLFILACWCAIRYERFECNASFFPCRMFACIYFQAKSGSSVRRKINFKILLYL
jgi:hypothetical protein